MSCGRLTPSLALAAEPTEAAAAAAAFSTASASYTPVSNYYRPVVEPAEYFLLEVLAIHARSVHLCGTNEYRDIP